MAAPPQSEFYYLGIPVTDDVELIRAAVDRLRPIKQRMKNRGFDEQREAELFFDAATRLMNHVQRGEVINKLCGPADNVLGVILRESKAESLHGESIAQLRYVLIEQYNFHERFAEKHLERFLSRHNIAFSPQNEAIKAILNTSQLWPYFATLLLALSLWTFLRIWASGFAILLTAAFLLLPNATTKSRFSCLAILVATVLLFCSCFRR